MTSLILERLSAHARQWPDRTLFGFYGPQLKVQRVSFHEFLKDVLAASKADHSPIPGSLHFISGATEYKSVVAYVAAIVNRQYPAFLSPLTTRSDPEIFTRELQQLLSRFRPQQLTGFALTERNYDHTPQEFARGSGFVQFSSGTIGLRKGVFIEDRALLQQIDALADRLEIDENSVIASWLPLYHDMGLITAMFLPMLTGASSFMMDPVEWSYRPGKIFDIIGENQATHCWQPDFALQHISSWLDTRQPGSIPSIRSLRVLTSCSEPCHVRTFERFYDRFQPYGLDADVLQTCYATAETVFAVTQSNFTGPCDWLDTGTGILSSGTPLPKCRITALDCDELGWGEIEIQCPFLFDGYLCQDTPGLSDNRFRTGDLGSVSRDTVTVYGRKDDTLIINGKKIIAHQIEQYFNAYPEVRGGRLICLANESSTALNIFYEGTDLSAENARRFRTWTATACGLSTDRIEVVPPRTLIKSSSGKLSRRKTMKRLAERGLLTSLKKGV